MTIRAGRALGPSGVLTFSVSPFDADPLDEVLDMRGRQLSCGRTIPRFQSGQDLGVLSYGLVLLRTPCGRVRRQDHPCLHTIKMFDKAAVTAAKLNLPMKLQIRLTSGVRVILFDGHSELVMNLCQGREIGVLQLRSGEPGSEPL